MLHLNWLIVGGMLGWMALLALVVYLEEQHVRAEQQRRKLPS